MKLWKHPVSWQPRTIGERLTSTRRQPVSLPVSSAILQYSGWVLELRDFPCGFEAWTVCREPATRGLERIPKEAVAHESSGTAIANEPPASYMRTLVGCDLRYLTSWMQDQGVVGSAVSVHGPERAVQADAKIELEQR